MEIVGLWYPRESEASDAIQGVLQQRIEAQLQVDCTTAPGLRCYSTHADATWVPGSNSQDIVQRCLLKVYIICEKGADLPKVLEALKGSVSQDAAWEAFKPCRDDKGIIKLPQASNLEIKMQNITKHMRRKEATKPIMSKANRPGLWQRGPVQPPKGRTVNPVIHIRRR